MIKKIIFILVLISCNLSFAQNSWKVLTQKADSLEAKYMFNETFTLRKKAIHSIAKKDKDTIQYLKLLKKISQLGVLISSSNNNDEKVKNFKELKKKTEQLSKLNVRPKRMRQAYNTIYYFARVYMYNLPEANSFLEKSINAHLQSKKIDTITLIQTMNHFGSISRHIGAFEKSIQTFKKAEKIYQALNKKKPSIIAYIYVDWANVFAPSFLNSPSKREFLLKKAEMTFMDSKNPRIEYVMALYTSLSGLNIQKGDYKEAILYLNKGRSLYLKNKTNPEKIEKTSSLYDLQFHSYLIEIYTKTDNNDKVRDHLEEMVKIGNRAKLDRQETDILSNAYLQASIYLRKTTNYKLAKTYINKGLSLNKKSKVFNFESAFLLEKAKIDIAKMDFNNALNLLIEVEKIPEKPKYIEQELLLTKTKYYIKKNDKENSYKYINLSLQKISRSENKKESKVILYSDYKSGPVLKDAFEIIDIAYQLKESNFYDNTIIKNLFFIALKQFKHNFSNQYLNKDINKIYLDIVDYFYNEIAQNNLSNKEKEKVLDFTAFIESKYLLNHFLDNRSIASNNKNNEYIEKAHLSSAKLVYLKKQFLTQKTDSIKQLIFDQRIYLESLKDSLKRIDKGFKTFIDYSIYKKNLQDYKDSHIIKFKILNNNLYRIVFHNGTMKIDNLKNYKDLEKQIDEFIKLIRNHQSSVKLINKKGTIIYKKLLGDLSNDNVADLFIIPVGILYFLPFEVLVKDSKYLIEQHNISYATSLAFLQSPIQENNNKLKKNIALFAPSYNKIKLTNKKTTTTRNISYHLQGAIDEAKAIQKIIGGDLFLKEQATKSSFKKVARKYAIIHLAMHSFLNDEDPELNHLAFTNNQKDSNLHIAELYALNIDANMVVLSACNTGIGTLKTGKGVVSMNTSFMASGIPSVLSSLWYTPDNETKQIMEEFYKNLKNGFSKKQALQKAKLNFLNTTNFEELKHPYYWGSFVLYGDTSKLHLTNQYPSWTYIIFILLIIMIFILIMVKLKQKRSLS